MGKVVKYCASCEEGFAEKFGFCPNCGAQLQAFEMNPIAAAAEMKAVAPEENEVSAPPPAPAAPEFIESSLRTEKAEEPAETIAFSENTIEEEKVEEVYDSFEEEEIVDEEPKVAAAAAAAGANGVGNGYHFKPAVDSTTFNQTNQESTLDDDGAYRITVIEEKNVKQRNVLLLGSMCLILTLAIGGVIVSLFNHQLGVSAIDEGNLFAYVPEITEKPMEVEEEVKKNDEEGGGGGGGGKENPKPASKGRLPDQVKDPVMPPQPLPQVTNASLPNPNQTQGNITRPRTNERVGLPTGLEGDASSGPGTGGGIGSGRGTGAGTGIGTGEGSGIGSGSGSGRGNGNGGGTGDGNDGEPPAVKKPPVGVTQAMRILSQPKPPYTDAARQNNVQGTVTLKVTFTASGTIGSITPVSGLPYGLTEQAISAARRIQFEPKKVNGVPQSVTRTVSYTFTIY